MTSEFIIPDAAVSAAVDEYRRRLVDEDMNPSAAMPHALAAALRFCKRNDDSQQFIAHNRHGKRLDRGDRITVTETGKTYFFEAAFADDIHVKNELGDLINLPVAAVHGLRTHQVGVASNARLRLFDGRFTLPLVVKSYPGVSFIHPSNCDSAPVAVVTCDDHPTIAAGIVDAVRVAFDAATEERRKEWKASVAAFYDSAAATFREANAEAMKTIRAACGGDLDKSWAEKARALFGDQKKSTLLTIGAALAKIAEALPGRVHIEVGYPEEAPAPIPHVTVNLSVSGSVDPEAAQRMADEVRKAVKGGISASSDSDDDGPSPIIREANRRTTDFIRTSAAILRPGNMPSTDELQELAASVGMVFVPFADAGCGDYAVTLRARIEAFATAIDIVKNSAPADTGVWSSHREWALRSIPTIERVKAAAEKALAAQPVKAPDEPARPSSGPGVHIQMVGRGTRAIEYADTSHMSGYTEGGVPRHGGTAMRQGWKVGANPWFRKDGSLAWEASLWLAQYHFENAECMKSHIDGENFKPLPPVQGIGE